MTELRQRLETFLHNVDLQIDDLQRVQAGKRIEVFFDTAHVVSAVLGLHDFYHGENFRHGKFNSPTALVTSLAASHWLGEIRLLPPHQAEFLRKWQFDFGVGSTRKPEVLVGKFLRDVGYGDNGWVIQKPLDRLTEEQIRALIMKYAGSAPTFFKALQSIVPW